MMRIAICDDEAPARAYLASLIRAQNCPCEIVEHACAGDCLAETREIDLLFLDVEMKGLNGMETAEKIRTFDEQILIVFVTGYSDYVFDGYLVGALDYLMKPVTEEKLRQLFRRIRARYAQEESSTFTLKNMDGTWRFRLCDILFFYSDRRKVMLVTAKGEYSFYARLDEIEHQLSPYFVRIHQRYLINPSHVDYLGSESVTINGRELPCSRRYRETALTKIARSIG